jgi:hypothetical protein
MTFEEFFVEGTRRDFLKRLGGAIIGSAVPGADKAVANMANTVPSLINKPAQYKIVTATWCRGMFDIQSVATATATSAKKLVRSIIDDAERRAQDTDDEDYHGYTDFIHPWASDEQLGIASGSLDEELAVYVVRQDNPLYKVFDGLQKRDGQGGWQSYEPNQAHDELEVGLGDWDEFQASDPSAYADYEEYEREREKRERKHEREEREREDARFVTLTLPRHVAQALYDALNKY